MAQSISCPSCGARLRLPDTPGDRKLRCPRCHGAVVATPPSIAISPGFVNAPRSNEIGDEAPIPLSQAVRKVRDTYNPFDDGSDEDNPKVKRRWKPKEEFNPFAEQPPSTVPVDDAGASSAFEFGIDDPLPPPPTGDFDFDDPADDSTRRRRR